MDYLLVPRSRPMMSPPITPHSSHKRLVPMPPSSASRGVPHRVSLPPPSLKAKVCENCPPPPQPHQHLLLALVCLNQGVTQLPPLAPIPQDRHFHLQGPLPSTALHRSSLRLRYSICKPSLLVNAGRRWSLPTFASRSFLLHRVYVSLILIYSIYLTNNITSPLFAFLLGLDQVRYLDG